MTYQQSPSAVVFGDVKSAALFFDRVIPLGVSEVEWEVSARLQKYRMGVPEPIPGPVAAELIFGSQADGWDGFLAFAEFYERHQDFLHRVRTHPELRANGAWLLSPGELDTLRRLYLFDDALPDGRTIRHEFAGLVAKLGVSDYSIVLPREETAASFGEAYSVLTLAGVPVIDTASTSWEQILDIRRDPEARARLRRLRLFFFENYVGKPRAFIEDDLFERLDVYDRVRREHGLETTLSAVSVVLRSNAIRSAAVGALMSALFGDPLVGITTAVAAELGGLTVELANRHVQIRNLERGHGLAYIIDARGRL